MPCIGWLKTYKRYKRKAFLKGKNVTDFTNQEEDAVQLSEIVPFSLEDILIENGGIYSKIDNWQPYAVENANLITGQNPGSSEKVAEYLIEKLKAKIIPKL